MIVVKELKQIITVIGVVLYGITNAFGQQDTLWYDIKWKKTTKENASFYRPPVKTEGNLYRVKDYYISGVLQMNATSKYIDKDYWEGKVTWYTEKGKAYQEGNYKNNKLDGVYKSFIQGKEIVSTYEKGVYVSGETNTNCGTYFIYLEETTEGYRRIYHNGDLGGLRYEQYLDKDKRKKYTKYYDKNGEFIGESKVLGNGSIAGVEVLYSYKPFSTSSMHYYSKRGEFLGNTIYYKNGNLREKFIEKPNYKTIYYNVDGKEIGAITYSMVNSYLRPQNGTKYHFFSNYNNKNEEKKTEDRISGITTYENEKVVKSIQKYENGKTKSLFTYKDGYKLLDVYYNESGAEISRLSYKNYKPFEGIEHGRDIKRIYKEGDLVEEIKYYPETKTKFMVSKDDLETYYDKEGEVLGTLKLTKGEYASPEEGIRYKYYKGVYERIEEYKSGNLVKVTALRKGSSGDYYKTIEVYDDSGYNKIKEVKFYHNGKVQSKIDYKKYNPVFGTYFNKNGEEIGKYDFKVKEGKRYEFFNETDQIKELEEIKNGKLVRSLSYERVYSYDKKDYDYILMQDIDSSKDAKFYDKKGKLIAKATFKNGEPYNGTVYDRKDRILYQIKDGKKNGKYERYDYDKSIIEKGSFKNDLKEGLFVNYNSSGAKVSSVNFVKGQPEGDAIYYNGKKVASKITYKDGKPYDGKKTHYDNYAKTYSEEIYEKGNLVKSLDSQKNGKIVTTHSSKILKEVVKYDLNDNKTLSYNLKNEILEGKVIAYDKDGNIERTAEFENGKLVAGKVKIKAQSYGASPGYFFLIRTDSTFAIEKYNEEGLEYKAFEKVEKGMRLNHLYKLDSKIEYTYPTDLE